MFASQSRTCHFSSRVWWKKIRQEGSELVAINRVRVTERTPRSEAPGVVFESRQLPQASRSRELLGGSPQDLDAWLISMVIVFVP